MPPRKCVTRDTDVSVSQRAVPVRGARAPVQAPVRTPVGAPAPKPDWPRIGDLVSLEWTPDRIIEGIVIDLRDRGWDPPMLVVLDRRGGTTMCASPSVKVISRRKKPRRRRRK